MRMRKKSPRPLSTSIARTPRSDPSSSTTFRIPPSCCALPIFFLSVLDKGTPQFLLSDCLIAFLFRIFLYRDRQNSLFHTIITLFFRNTNSPCGGKSKLRQNTLKLRKNALSIFLAVKVCGPCRGPAARRWPPEAKKEKICEATKNNIAKQKTTEKCAEHFSRGQGP